jgi:hypothetical protein
MSNRENRYAEALYGRPVLPNRHTLALITAVMAVADEERAADRAEIERLRAQVQLMCPHLSLSGAEADLWRCDECGLIGTQDDIEAAR